LSVQSRGMGECTVARPKAARGVCGCMAARPLLGAGDEGAVVGAAEVQRDEEASLAPPVRPAGEAERRSASRCSVLGESGGRSPGDAARAMRSPWSAQREPDASTVRARVGVAS
jgi:hypothetical protein